MEEDLNVYTEQGVATFGKLFGAALKAPLVLDQTLIQYGDDFPLKLSYKLSGRTYVGIMRVSCYAVTINVKDPNPPWCLVTQVPLIQKDLDPRIVDMCYDLRVSAGLALASVTEQVMYTQRLTHIHRHTDIEIADSYEHPCYQTNNMY